MHYDIAIAYRIYPGVSKSPFIGKDDKLSLSKICLGSLKRALGDLRVKVFAILDGCPEDYVCLFQEHFEKDDLEIIRVNRIGNQSTFGLQMEILLNQRDSENIYLAEDDYLYGPGNFAELLVALKHPKIDFISPYDHLDYYNPEKYKIHDHPSRIYFCGSRHWREASSTTLTFLTTKKVLRAAEPVFRSFLQGNRDVNIWMAITKKNVFRVDKLFYAGLTLDFRYCRVIVEAWLRSFIYLLCKRPRRLVVPVPSIATHLESDCVAPGINWYEFIKEP